MIMEYVEKLKEFEGSKSSKALEQQFEELANYFLKDGYFLVNNERKIYICDVEFYYHEEFDGGIKDWIMYHRDLHPNNKTEKLGYLQLGQLNSHASGLDVTFENPDEKYRAGMLIRGFKIVEPIVEPKPFDYSHTKYYDERSTHFYDALLNSGGNFTKGFSITWENKELIHKGYDIIQTYRKNVPAFIAENVTEKYTETNKPVTYKKQKCNQCPRKWRFHFENNKK